MDSSSRDLSTPSPSATAPVAPFFSFGSPASLSELGVCLQDCLRIALRRAFKGGDSFSLVAVQQPVVLNTDSPGGADGILWAQIGVRVIFEAPSSLIEGLKGSGQ